jgi:mannan endo-1,4-beta-mannosidase
MYCFTGMNYWSCMNLAAEDEAGGDQRRFLKELDQMAAAGINHLRVMAATQGAEDREPFRVLPALQDKPDHWDERLFVGLDRCIAEAGKRGMRLTMVLGNTWQWTGGDRT